MSPRPSAPSATTFAISKTPAASSCWRSANLAGASQENGSAGTDHGAAAPVFLFGDQIKAGIHGHAPDLANLVDGDIVHETDFRQVYATVLERWLGTKSEPLLGRPFGIAPGDLKRMDRTANLRDKYGFKATASGGFHETCVELR